MKTSGRNLVDANGNVLPRLKGFNVQPVPWPAQAYIDMHTLGARFVRTIVFWDKLEPTQGSISGNYAQVLDAHLGRCRSAGLYTTLCLYYGPGGKHCPGWVGSGSAGSKLGNYVKHGQHATQYLAQRYGEKTSALYNPSVVGFGINEPTPDSISNTSLTTMMVQQKTMMQWFRAYAPDWIGIIATPWASSSPLPNIAAAGHTGDQTFTGMASDPFGGMGNWLLDLHSYYLSTTDGASRIWDGRNQYGQPNNSATIKAINSSYPPAGIPRTRCQLGMAAFHAPFVTYCGHANVPLMIGEWGWEPTVHTGGDNYAADKAAAMASAGAAIEAQWDYNVSTTNDLWAARPNGSWQSATRTWMAAA